MNITGHVIIRNEDQFIEFAINSALPFLDRLIIYDTGSVDKTVSIIKSIKSPKILFAQKGSQSPTGITVLRNEMIAQTKTDWFFLLDGDEIWNSQIIQDYLKFTLNQPKNILATFLRTRNCVGDIYHYRDESFGRYEIAGLKGHLNIRAYRRTLRWTGEYPLEKCVDTTDKNSLAFFDDYYWHLTHLRRSSSEESVLGFRRRVFDLGIATKSDELPEVFLDHYFPKRSRMYEVVSVVVQFFKSHLPAFFLAGFFFIGYFLVLLIKHNYQFQTFGLDLGFYDQIIYKASQWDFTKSTIAEVLNRNYFLSFFENDFHPVLLLISFLYKIIPGINWIFFVQALFSALIGLVVYFIAKAKTQNQLFSLACSFILLFSVPYQHVVFDGFTPEVFGALFLALAFLGLVKNNLKIFWISIFGMLVSKVEFSPVVAILGLTIIVFEKKVRQGMTTTIIGVLAFLLLVYVVNPLISPDYQNYAHYSLGYGQIGQNPQEVIVNLITKPFFVLQALTFPIIKLQYLFQQLFSFGFIPLLNPTIFPLLFFELFTRMGNNIMIAKWPLHSYTISVLLAIGTIYFSAKFKNKITIFAGILLLFSLIGDIIFHGPLNSFSKSDFYTYNRWAKNNQELLDIVPGNVAVSANNSLVPHLSQREKIYLLPNIADAQYVAIDLQDRPNAHTPSSYSANSELIKKLLIQNRFKIIFQKENAVLLKRL